MTKRALSGPSRRTSYTIQQKLDILQELKQPGTTKAEVARKYGLKDTSILKSWEEKETSFRAILSTTTQQQQPTKTKTTTTKDSGKCTKKIRPSAVDHPELESAMILWMSQQKGNNVTMSLTDEILLEQARTFAEIFGLKDFQASESWLEQFKDRQNLKSLFQLQPQQQLPPQQQQQQPQQQPQQQQLRLQEEEESRIVGSMHMVIQNWQKQLLRMILSLRRIDVALGQLKHHLATARQESLASLPPISPYDSVSTSTSASAFPSTPVSAASAAANSEAPLSLTPVAALMNPLHSLFLEEMVVTEDGECLPLQLDKFYQDLIGHLMDGQE